MVTESNEHGAFRESEGAVIEILAAAYLRLLAQHGPNLREHWQLRPERKLAESAESGGLRLDFPENRSIRCTGQRGVTETPEGS